MSDGARMKGVGMVAAVTAFRGERDAMQEIAPERLKRYLQERVSEQEWYPYEDLIGVLRLIARVNLPFLSEEEAFRWFGAVSAQRDLVGQQDQINDHQRVSHAGSYKGAVGVGHSPAELLRRGWGLFQLYHECGEFKLTRLAERRIRAELVDFPYKIPEMCLITSGFAEEMNRMTGLISSSTEVGCRCKGDPACVWEITFDDAADVSSLDEFGTVPPA